VRNGDLRGREAGVARRISHAESDCIDAAVAIAIAVGPQLHRLAVRCDDNITAGAGVGDFPARVKCASLSWHTLHAALNDQQAISTE